jgi:hypothetical protein
MRVSEPRIDLEGATHRNYGFGVFLPGEIAETLIVELLCASRGTADAAREDRRKEHRHGWKEARPVFMVHMPRTSGYGLGSRILATLVSGAILRPNETCFPCKESGANQLISIQMSWFRTWN